MEIPILYGNMGTTLPLQEPRISQRKLQRLYFLWRRGGLFAMTVNTAFSILTIASVMGILWVVFALLQIPGSVVPVPATETTINLTNIIPANTALFATLTPSNQSNQSTPPIPQNSTSSGGSESSMSSDRYLGPINSTNSTEFISPASPASSTDSAHFTNSVNSPENPINYQFSIWDYYSPTTIGILSVLSGFSVLRILYLIIRLLAYYRFARNVVTKDFRYITWASVLAKYVYGLRENRSHMDDLALEDIPRLVEPEANTMVGLVQGNMLSAPLTYITEYTYLWIIKTIWRFQSSYIDRVQSGVTKYINKRLKVVFILSLVLYPVWLIIFVGYMIFSYIDYFRDLQNLFTRQQYSRDTYWRYRKMDEPAHEYEDRLTSMHKALGKYFSTARRHITRAVMRFVVIVMSLVIAISTCIQYMQAIDVLTIWFPALSQHPGLITILTNMHGVAFMGLIVAGIKYVSLPNMVNHDKYAKKVADLMGMELYQTGGESPYRQLSHLEERVIVHWLREVWICIWLPYYIYKVWRDVDICEIYTAKYTAKPLICDDEPDYQLYEEPEPNKFP